MRIAVIDNYDSFTYNLVQYLNDCLDTPVEVFRNDAIAVEDLAQYDGLVLSPGPGLPKDAGILLEVIATYAGKIPMLGVCLGLQAIGEHYGGHLVNLDKVYHGVATSVEMEEPSCLFEGLEEPIDVGRYHSWIVANESFPEVLKVTARDESGAIMAAEHRADPVFGVQFHPESILTPQGRKMISNFVQFLKEYQKIKN